MEYFTRNLTMIHFLLPILMCLLPACGDDSPDPSPTDPTPAPTATPVPNPLCEEVMYAKDGPGGFLWKAAERTGNLVVLFPGKFDELWDSVTAELQNGDIVPLYDTGWANADPDGLRQHWRYDLRPGRFKDNSLVIAQLGPHTCAWRIGKANERND